MGNAEITPQVCHVSLPLSASISVGCIAESKVKESVCNYGRYCQMSSMGLRQFVLLLEEFKHLFPP